MIDPKVLRDDPDRVRAAQAKRGLSDDVVDRALAADAARRSAIVDLRGQAGRAEAARQADPAGPGRGEGRRCSRAPRTLSAEVKAAEAAQTEAEEAWRAALMAIPNLAADEAPAGGEDDFVVLETVGDAAASSTSSRATTSSSAGCSAPSTSSAAPRCPGSRFYFLTGIGAAARVRAGQHGDGPGPRRRLHPDDRRRRWSSRARWRAPASSARPPTTSTGSRAQDLYLVGTSEVPMAAYHSDEILDAEHAAAALRRVQPVLPQGGRLARQGHPRHLPGALVRQGRDVRLHHRRGVRTPSTSGCWSGRRSSSTSSSSPTA